MNVSILVVAGFLLSMFFWPLPVDLVGEHQTPVPVFGGASIWAGLVIELLVILTAVALSVRAQRSLDVNSERISERFHFGKSKTGLIELRRREISTKPLLTQLMELAWLPIRSVSAVPSEHQPDSAVTPLEHLVARYLFRGRCRARVLRVCLVTAVSVVALVLVDNTIGTSFIEIGILVPSDELGTRSTSAALSFVALLSIQFLVFLVADALALSRAFIAELRLCRPAWPAESIDHADKELCLEESPLRAWLALRLVATRTE
jgi:hypothetical protein